MRLHLFVTYIHISKYNDYYKTDVLYNIKYL